MFLTVFGRFMGAGHVVFWHTRRNRHDRSQAPDMGRKGLQDHDFEAYRLFDYFYSGTIPP